MFLFMFLIGCTGLLLGWKKNVDLLPPTQKGVSLEASEWLSLQQIAQIAAQYATDSLQVPPSIDRIDVRPQKGVAKIIFEEHFGELQIDLKTGEIRSVGTRYSDIIEKIHDGSIIDHYLGIGGDPVKVTYTTLASLGLVLLSLSGFWLWYNPKRMRKMKEKRRVEAASSRP